MTILNESKYLTKISLQSLIDYKLNWLKSVYLNDILFLFLLCGRTCGNLEIQIVVMAVSKREVAFIQHKLFSVFKLLKLHGQLIGLR